MIFYEPDPEELERAMESNRILEEKLEGYKNRNPKFPVHANIGEKVWYAGDCWEWASEVTVDERNYDIVNAFWGRLYFSNYDAAKKRNWQARREYGEYQASLL